MADGKVEITLSVKDAEALRAWQRGKQGISEMSQELNAAKKATAGVSSETKKLATAQAAGWKALSAAGQAYKNQQSWAKGLTQIETQRAQITAAAARSADQHWKRQIAIAQAAKETAAATEEMGEAIDDTGDAGDNMVTKMVAGLAKMTAGAFTLSKAIGMARAEYDAMVQRGKAAAGFQVDLAGAQRAAIRNLSGKELSPNQLSQMLGGIQGRTGADLKALWAGASQVLSARGNLSEGEAIAELAAVAQMDPSMQGDELALTAGAAMDLRKRFRGGPEQAIGAMLTSQQTSRLTSTGDFAANAVPAIVGLGAEALGNSYREASALYATITQESADFSGRRSGSAAIRFAQQLTEATPFLPAGTSTLQRREWLMSGDPEAETIRRRLLGSMRHDVDEAEMAEAVESDPTRKADLHAEAKQWTTILGLLERGSAAAKALAEQLAATPEYERAGQRYQQNLDQQRELGLQKTVRQAEIARAGLQTMLQDESRAAVSQIRTGAQELLEQAGSFGRPIGALAGTETGLLSKLSMIEMGAPVPKEAAEGYGYFTGPVTPQAKRSNAPPLPPVIQAIDASIEEFEGRLSNARANGQIDDPQWAKTREGIEQYIARQKEERKKLIDELERQKGERERSTLVVAPWQSRAAQAPAAAAGPPAAPGPETSAPRIAPEARMQEYSRLAREAAATAAEPAAQKDQAKADRKAEADQKRFEGKRAAIVKAAQTEQTAALKAADKLDAQATGPDQRRIDEVRKRIAFKERLQSLPPARGSSRGAKSQPQQQLRENEEMRQLRRQLADAERVQANHQAQAQEKRDETNKILAEMKKGIDALVAGQKGGSTAPARPRQGSPAAIGGN